VFAPTDAAFADLP